MGLPGIEPWKKEHTKCKKKGGKEFGGAGYDPVAERM
jgi:hypothetical protein